MAKLCVDLVNVVAKQLGFESHFKTEELSKGVKVRFSKGIDLAQFTQEFNLKASSIKQNDSYTDVEISDEQILRWIANRFANFCAKQAFLQKITTEIYVSQVSVTYPLDRTNLLFRVDLERSQDEQAKEFIKTDADTLEGMIKKCGFMYLGPSVFDYRIQLVLYVMNDDKFDAQKFYTLTQPNDSEKEAKRTAKPEPVGGQPEPRFALEAKQASGAAAQPKPAGQPKPADPTADFGGGVHAAISSSNKPPHRQVSP